VQPSIRYGTFAKAYAPLPFEAVECVVLAVEYRRFSGSKNVVKTLKCFLTHPTKENALKYKGFPQFRCFLQFSIPLFFNTFSEHFSHRQKTDTKA